MAQTDEDGRPFRIVRHGNADIQVFVQGSGPAVVVLPSYGRDSAEDYDEFTKQLVKAGYLVLRPQPRGIMKSIGPMAFQTLQDMAGDVVQVIDQLAGGRGIILGHAFGNFLARIVARDWPDKAPAIGVVAAQGTDVPADIAKTPFIAGNLSGDETEADRLAALQTAFFAKGHDARPWLAGWYRDTFQMQRDAVHAPGAPKLKDFWGGGKDTQILEIIASEDPFKQKGQWGQMRELFPDRVETHVVENAAHALFPEQCEKVVEIVLPWLKKHAAATR